MLRYSSLFMKEVNAEKYAFLGLFSAVLVSVYIYTNSYTVLIVVRPVSYQGYKNNSLSSAVRKGVTVLHRRSFDIGDIGQNTDWCRVYKEKFDWMTKIATCEGATTWNSKRRIDVLSKQHKTAANLSYIKSYSIQKVGQASKFVIQSVSVADVRKTFGGDSWRVRIRGPSSVPVTVLDNLNGTYEVIFYPTASGLHLIYIFLDYTMCNGIVNPPENWFIKGTSQGKYQHLSIIGQTHDFINKAIGSGVPFEAYVPAEDRVDPNGINYLPKYCPIQCQFLWSSFGGWKSDHWAPLTEDYTYRQRIDQRTTIPAGRLILYGDSVTVFMYHSLRRRKEICGKLFVSCEMVYNWIYRIHNITRAKTERDSLDFNVSRIVSELQSTLSNKLYNNKDSAVILNFGLHFVESTNFSNYKLLIDKIVRLVNKKYPNGSPYYKQTVIWKTTTAINKERASLPQLHHRRFLTSPRIQLFNSYANAAMCQANIPIIDVYGISDAYPYGTGTHSGRNAVKNDVVHYHNEVFYAVEDFLLRYFYTNKVLAKVL